MKDVVPILLLFVATSAVAQSVDTTKAKQPNTFSKYQQPSQYGIQPTITLTPAATGQPDPNMVKKIEQKRVSSTYQYTNGRVTGGKTTLHFDKKKD